MTQEARSAATGRDTWSAGSRPWKPCPDTESHPRHEWLDGVKREDCPGVSAASTLFQPRTEEGAIDLMVSDGPKRCICCPPHHQHVFAYGHALPGKSAGGYPRHADDLVRDVLHEAFRTTEDVAAVNRMRVRVTVELLPEEES